MGGANADEAMNSLLRGRVLAELSFDHAEELSELTGATRIQRGAREHDQHGAAEDGTADARDSREGLIRYSPSGLVAARTATTDRGTPKHRSWSISFQLRGSA